MAKPKLKVNPKEFLLKKGEWIAIGVAGLVLVILLGWGVSTGMSAPDPEKESKDLLTTSNSVRQRISTGIDEPTPLGTWVRDLKPGDKVPPEAFAQTGLFFGFSTMATNVITRIGGDLWVMARGTHLVDFGDTLSAGSRNMSTISWRDDSDSVTIRALRYTGGARRNSSSSPRRARATGFSTMRHISACTWWRKTTRGTCAHSGEKNGMPFQISTMPSRAPVRPTRPLSAVRGNTA